VDGLKGFPKAIEPMYPQAKVQHSVVHMGAAQPDYVSRKQRRAVAADLRTIYEAATAEAAELALDRFSDKWDATHPRISQVWRRTWERIIMSNSYPPEIRKMIYRTKAVESLNMSPRRIIKTRGSLPNEEAAVTLAGPAERLGKMELCPELARSA
jgi:putative transposase